MCRDFAPPGVPDGMCVDPADGSLYIAVWDGYRIERRSSAGTLMGTIQFPMAKVTSACIGDDSVFVTTASRSERTDNPDTKYAGGVFVIRRDKGDGVKK